MRQKATIQHQVFLVLILQFSVYITGMAQPQSATEQKEWVQSIYHNIATAMGLVDRPAVEVDPFGRSSVAAMHYQKHQIVVDQQFVELCWRQFPTRAEDAMAFVLGHELAHYKFQHQWGEEFASSYAITDIAKDVGATQASLKALPMWETQADQVGGIFAYLAGYQPGDMAGPLLTAIYDTYGFPTQMEGYPSLQDRKAIAAANEQQVSNWIKIYETGNYATLAGAYAVADYCFSHVIQEGFSSREVLNNHAVSLIQQALLGMDDEKVRFAYPVELDLETRLSQNSRGAAEPEVLLARARQRLMQATWVDPTYATSWLNLACVQSLLGELEDADFYASKSLALANNQGKESTAANAIVTIGIIAAQQGDNKAAQQWWKEADKMGASLAEINRTLLKEGLEELSLSVAPATVTPSIPIDGIYLPNEWGQQPFLPEPILHGMRHLYVCIDLPASDMYFFQIKDSKGWVFHATRPNYTKPLVEDIRRGTLADQLQAILGAPRHILSTAQGEVWHYADKALLVQLDMDRKITGWITYLQSR